MSDMRKFSNSELQTFKRCRRKWWLSYWRRLRKVDNDPVGPLKSGTRVHAALEAYYVPEGEGSASPVQSLKVLQEQDWVAYEDALTQQGLEPMPDIVQQFKSDCELESIMLQGYMQWLVETGVDAELKVIQPEKTLKVNGKDVQGNTFVGNWNVYHDDWAIIGKLDAQVQRTTDGAILFMDHKTLKSPAQQVKMLQRNEQMLHYHLMSTLTLDESQRPGGALYNILKKVKRTAKARPPFYERHEIYYSDEEIEAYRMRLLGIISAILDVEARLNAGENPLQVVYPTPSNDCSWDCEFNQVCGMFDDGSRVEAALDDMYVTNDPIARYHDDSEIEDSKT